MTTVYYIVLLTLITCHVAGNTLEDDATTTMIGTLLGSKDTQSFLASFPNVNQRYIIQTQLRYCPYTALCGYSFRMKTDDVFDSCCEDCSCNVNRCHLGNTCCPDLKNMSSNKPIEVKRPKMECQLMHLAKKKTFDQKAVYMFASCPEGANTTVQHLCVRSYGGDDASHFSDIVPVTHKNNNNVYRNKFCAFCNNLTENEINFWYPRISCKGGNKLDIKREKGVIQEAYRHNNCDIAFEPHHKANMEYCTKAVSTCNETGLWKTYDPLLEKACSFYITEHHQTYVFDDVYNNIFCMLCNGREPSKYQCDFGKNSIAYNPFSFTGLLDFSFFDDSIGQPTPEVCSINSRVDPYQKMCRELHCSPVRKLKNGECFKLYSEVGEMVYIVYIRLVPDDVISVRTAHALADRVLGLLILRVHISVWTKEEVPKMCGKQIIYKTATDITNNPERENLKGSTLLYYDIKIEFLKKKLYDPDLVMQNIMDIENSTETFRLNDETFSFTVTLRDDTGELFDYYSNLSYHQYRNTSTNLWPPLSLSDMASEAVADTDGKIIVPYFHMNDKFMWGCAEKKDRLKVSMIKNCTMFQLSYHEFENEETIEGIYFTKRGYLLKNSDFYYTGDSEDHISVCSDLYFKFAEQQLLQTVHSLDAETVLSIVCVSLSILSLLVTLATFSLFPQLRTLPGKNNISLVVSLLIAQIMYLIGSVGSIPLGSVACKAVGIAVHFCWLHSVCWMNVCTFHMFRVFFKVRQLANDSSTKRLVRYHLYSIAVPTCMVSINITVALLSSGNHDIGYGTTICYISSSQMVGFTFGVPVATLLVANIVMFIAAAVKIKRTGEIQSNAKHNRDNLTIITKLSTLTGITWIFGFVYSFTNVTAISYIFIVLNASQGLLLMLSFVFNRRILDMYRHKLFEVAPSIYTDTQTRNNTASTRT